MFSNKSSGMRSGRLTITALDDLRFRCLLSGYTESIVRQALARYYRSGFLIILIRYMRSSFVITGFTSKFLLFISLIGCSNFCTLLLISTNTSVALTVHAGGRRIGFEDVDAVSSNYDRGTLRPRDRHLDKMG